MPVAVATPLPSITYNDRKLVTDKDYILEYDSNISVGTATVKVIGKNNFYGVKNIIIRS